MKFFAKFKLSSVFLCLYNSIYIFFYTHTHTSKNCRIKNVTSFLSTSRRPTTPLPLTLSFGSKRFVCQIGHIFQLRLPNIKTNTNAVPDATLPNPFLSDPVVQPQTGDLKSSSGAGSKQNKTMPPMRPPPPTSASVAHFAGSGSANAPTKSPFDDLNDTIRMALVSSPAKQANENTGSLGINHPQSHQSPLMQPQNVVGAQSYGTNQQVFSSTPSNQPFQGLL